MQTVRTVFWVVFAVALTAFASMNFDVVEVNVWPQGEGYLHLEWPLALLIVVSFLLGFVPMFFAYRTARWTAQRKIKQQDQTIALLRPTPAPVSTEIAPVTPTTPSSTETTA